MSHPTCLGELRHAVDRGLLPHRSVKREIRENLICKLRTAEPLFPGIIGYDDTVIPQIVNALLSQHNFIVLGLRGQAKSRILRALVDLLDETIPVVAGCEINDDPLAPICGECRARVRDQGDGLPIEWLPRALRYVEKLATPDVTIADMVGDIDPIKAARGGLRLSDELTVHYGLLPRANRGIFAVNELPDLAGKIQVGLLNILQEGDIQIKGYPVRLPLDVLIVFTANPEDYTARGKIITPLRDRIGSEVRTHDPQTRELAMLITEQEAWVNRECPDQDQARGRRGIVVPAYVREVVEEVAFQARHDQKIDKRSGVSQRLPIACLENVVSNAERRAFVNREDPVVARVTDVYTALPSMTGKLELEYEGELRGADNVARELIRAAVANVFASQFDGVDAHRIVEWFDLGGTLHIGDSSPSADVLEQIGQVQGLVELVDHIGVKRSDPQPVVAAAVDFVLEGLHAQKRISRSEEWTYRASEQPRRSVRTSEQFFDQTLPRPGQERKKYYN